MNRLQVRVVAASLALSLANLCTLGSSASAATIAAEMEGRVFWVSDPATGVELDSPVHVRIRYDDVAVPTPITSE